MLSYIKSFTQSDGLRAVQTDIVKVFVFLYALRAVNTKTIKINDVVFEINANLIRYVYVVFGAFIFLWLFRFLRELMLHTASEASVIEAAIREPNDKDVKTQTITVGAKSNMKEQLEEIDKIRFFIEPLQDILGSLVFLIDFFLMLVLALLCLYFAWMA